jgi:lipopolysaccharide assembly protein A
MRFVKWVILALVAACLVAFAVANRQPVELNLYPIPVVADLPLYVIAFAALIIGFFLGGLAAWLSAGKWRRRNRQLRRELREQETAHRHQTAVTGAPAPAPGPAGGRDLTVAGAAR